MFLGSHRISKRASVFDNFVKGYSEGTKVAEDSGFIEKFVGGVIGGVLCIFFCKGVQIFL